MEFKYKAKNGRYYAIEMENGDVAIYDSIGFEVTDDQKVYDEIMSIIQEMEVECL
jgi:hypothetical protein